MPAVIYFASSFDSGVPLAPWVVTGAATIVAGRDANGVLVNGGSKLDGSFSGAATVYAGVAANGTRLGGFPLILTDTSSIFGCVADVRHQTGDGRISVFLVTGFNSDLFTFPTSLHANLYYFYLLKATITQTILSVDPSHSNVTQRLDVDLYINNEFIGSATKVGSAVIANTDIPIGKFSKITLFPPGGGSFIWDDVYVADTLIGDAKVESDDATVTVETAVPDLTQAVIEVKWIDSTAVPVMTQDVIEVKLGPVGALTIACPLSNSGTVGVPFTATLADVTSGGLAPYTWSIVSGSLPPGLSLDSATGIISGIPLSAGSFSVTIQVTDSFGATATTGAPCPLVIVQAPPPGECIAVPVPGFTPTLIALQEPLEQIGS